MPFFIRLFHWEYWPMHLIYFPIYMYYLWLSWKAKAFVFFNAANPAIEFGGLFGESKMDILHKIPAKWIPRTLFISQGEDFEKVLREMKQANIFFPLILKPDVGERGFLVEKIDDEASLKEALSKLKIDMLIQEFITYEEEVSILYYRYPQQEHGTISSFTLKKFLSITGDGHSSLDDLIKAYPRAKLQYKKLKRDLGKRMDEVLPKGEKIQLVPIGNHSRGTMFLDGNHLIDHALHKTFDQISKELKGIYFGRFDIKCKSVEALKAGKDFKILEINGVKAEPTHIYQPGFSLWKAYKVLFRQWRVIYEISMINHQLGTPFPSLWEAISRIRTTNRYKKEAEAQSLL